MLKDVFEEVYVINMPRRTDRWEQFNARLPGDWPFKKPVRYEALDGGVVTPPTWWDGGHGAWGCYKTHLRILEDCLNRSVSTVLILEDDAVCIEGFREKVEQFWQYLPQDWEMLYLGGQHIQENLRLPRKVNDWVYQPFNVNRCHCYGFRGRRMIERAYRHLNDFANWKALHHVDHYLGELHKVMDTGLYAPREWLVAQSEGQSDICGAKLELRFFPSSEETMFPKIDLPCVALMGTYFSGINTMAGAINALGVWLGVELGKPENEPQFYEELYLGEICRNCFAEPWLEEKLTFEDRVNHLRRWAGLQCKSKPVNTKLLCGKHPLLSLMGPELSEAWNNPKVICIDRPDDECHEAMRQVRWCWHPQAIKYSFDLMRKSRETFFEQNKPSMLRIAYETFRTSPEQAVTDICEFLEHEPNDEQLKNAIHFIQNVRNDLCY
jgi:hypothetical protein